VSPRESEKRMARCRFNISGMTSSFDYYNAERDENDTSSPRKSNKNNSHRQYFSQAQARNVSRH
jgi:hypothetical protein